MSCILCRVMRGDHVSCVEWCVETMSCVEIMYVVWRPCILCRVVCGDHVLCRDYV